jgi:hypothetical protein
MLGKKKPMIRSSFTELNADEQKKIIDTLLKKKYKARTLTGLSNETKISVKTIKENILWNSNFSKRLKILPNRSNNGKVLITTKERFLTDASLGEKFIDFFASNRQEIEVGE